MDVCLPPFGRIQCVQLAGRLHASKVEALSAKLLPLTDNACRQLVLSLAELDSISSLGLRLLLQLAHRSKDHGGALMVCELHGFVLEVFETSGFIEILPIETSRAAAIQRVSKAAD